MNRVPVFAFAAAVCVLLTTLPGCQRQREPGQQGKTRRGKDTRAGVSRSRVLGDTGPLEGAIVQVPGQSVLTTSDRFGRISLKDAQHPVLAIFKPGYLIKRVEANELSGANDVRLARIPVQDSPNYAWVNPAPDDSKPDNCGTCHSEVYDQWRGGAHARAATNPRFLHLYDGHDAEGNENVGWSLLRDLPEGAGVCLSCHAPSTSHKNLDNDIRSISAVEQLGVHCDFCHKAQDTVDEKQFGIAHGVYALKLLRPASGQVVFGPRTDSVGLDNAHAPVQKESRFCATCHEGTVFGVHVYSTWSEWQQSPAGKRGVHCQDCHMKPNQKMTNTAPGHGGPERSAQDIASHDLLPGGIEAMLKGCLHTQVDTEKSDGRWKVTVSVTATEVGHAVPTGFIDRHLILCVMAWDANGNAIKPSHGPLLPTVVGPQSGKGGLLFAKRIIGSDKSLPTPFWREVSDIDDTRLQPDTTRREIWMFPANARTIEVALTYRRFWWSVAKAKKWTDNEKLVFRKAFRLE